jgi:predicted alpha/beta-fold hydrolase
MNPELLRGVETFREFDERFTAPLHGFRDAEDYWERSSCLPFLSEIDRPCLLVNAANDPFLGPGCYPREVAAGSAVFHLEVPETGGHVGFPGGDGGWMERRALEFLRS